MKSILKSTTAVRAPETETGSDDTASQAIAQLRGLKPDTTLNDEQLATIIEKNEGQELDTDQWLAEIVSVEASVGADEPELSDEDKAKAVTVLSKVHGLAVAAAAIAAQSKELDSMIREAVDHEEKAKVRPLSTMRLILSIHGNAFGGMPLVGSEYDPKSNRLADKYKYSVKSANGEDQTVQGSYWRDYAESLPAGKDEIAAIAAVKAQTDEKVGSRKARRLKLKKHEARLESVVKAVRIAVRLAQIMDRLNTECGKVECYHAFTWQRDAKGKKIEPETKDYSVAKEPIYMGSTEPEDKGSEEDTWDYFAVSQILSIDVDKAKVNGGGYAAVRATMKRPAKDKTQTIPACGPKNFNVFATNMVNMSDEDKAFIERALLDPKADALVLTLGALRDWLVKACDPVDTAQGAGNNRTPSRLNRLRQKQADADAALLKGKQQDAA